MPVELTANPEIGGYYADTGLVNGQAYEYQVSVVDVQGQEVNFSDWVTVTPSDSIPTISWDSPPGAGSDSIPLYTTVSSGGGTLFPELLVAGQAHDGGGPSNAPGLPGPNQTAFDSTSLPDGMQTLKLFTWADANSVSVTPLLSINVQNGISQFICDGLANTSQGDVLRVDAAVPADTSQWEVQILDDSDNVLRSWQASAPNVHLAWDGLLADGTTAPDGDYWVQITTQGSSATPSNPSHTQAAPQATYGYRKKKRMALAKDGIHGLALINEVSPKPTTSTIPDADVSLRNVIQGVFDNWTNTYQTINGVPFSGKVFLSSQETPDVDKQIINWMKASVVDFYVCPGHGHAYEPYPQDGGSPIPAFVQWGNLVFTRGDADEVIQSNIRENQNDKPLKFHNISDLTVGHRYLFAWLDECDTAGGDPSPAKPNPGVEDDKWADAFHIPVNPDPDAPYAQTFFGWNGQIGLNASDNGAASNMELWRESFWKKLGLGQYVQQAFDNTPATPDILKGGGTISPKDSGRPVLVGDPYDTLLPDE